MKTFLIRLLEGLVLMAVVAGSVLWLSGGFETRISPEPVASVTPPPPEHLRRAIVAQITAPAFECASGVLESANRTTISSRILARIEEVRVSAGDRVSAGKILIKLDARDLKARVQQARKRLQAARAELELARVEEKRAKELLERGVDTRQRYDRALSALRVAEAEVERLKREVEEAQASLSYAVIKSPVSGRVVDRLAEPGDTAAPGTPLLRIYDPSRLRVEAAVRESLAVHLKIGDRLQVRIPALNKEMTGVIEEIVPYAEQGARTLLVKVALPPDKRLIAGMFARVGVPAGERKRLYIPAGAVERIGQLEFVKVIGPSEQMEKRLVTTGLLGPGGRIEVLSGLQAGETVLWDSAHRPAIADRAAANTCGPPIPPRLQKQ